MKICMFLCFHVHVPFYMKRACFYVFTMYLVPAVHHSKTKLIFSYLKTCLQKLSKLDQEPMNLVGEWECLTPYMYIHMS